MILAIGDLNGIARGKRLQAGMWDKIGSHGVAMANAIFQMDMTSDVWDTPYGNFGNGYPDIHVVPIPGTMRKVPWEDGVVITVCSSEEPSGAPVPVDPRNVLRTALDRAAAHDYEVFSGVELEFYLLDPETRLPRDQGISVYGLARGARFEHVLGPIRNLCTEMGIIVEVSNPEYSPGQFEVNIRFDTAMKSADNAMLFRNSVKEIAWEEGYLATFMAKPFFDLSGSGFHTHTSLWKDGANAFADNGQLSSLGRAYLGGLQKHMPELGLISAPTPNAMKRRQPYTFCPTNNCWGADNRTVGLRVIDGSDSAVRIEQRDGSADANPYLLLGAQLAAGMWGIENHAEPDAKETGNGYENATATPLPSDIPSAIALFRESALLADLIPDTLRETMIQQAEREQQFMIDSGVEDPFGTVTEVERDRYLDNF